MSDKCKICGRELDHPNDPTTKDCGGDCLKCMAEIGEDPDCIAVMEKITRRGSEPLSAGGE